MLEVLISPVKITDRSDIVIQDEPAHQLNLFSWQSFFKWRFSHWLELFTIALFAAVSASILHAGLHM